MGIREWARAGIRRNRGTVTEGDEGRSLGPRIRTGWISV